MSDFQIGDKVWTWSITIFGRYIPHFSEYEITDIERYSSNQFAHLSIEGVPNLSMPFEFIFSSKNEAIDKFIELIGALKDEVTI